jgi:hypothetical protein
VIIQQIDNILVNQQRKPSEVIPNIILKTDHKPVLMYKKGSHNVIKVKPNKKKNYKLKTEHVNETCC